MGPLFIPSILSMITLGISPAIFKRIFSLKKDRFAQSTKNIKEIVVYATLLAFGYGLVSTIWHCCSFFDSKMFFFFFVIKLIQLWAVCSFFFKYGLKLLLNKVKPWAAYLMISILFGMCYPWHTLGFAITFTSFGLGLCYLTKKTDSYYFGLILLYFAYIFHAGLPWHGGFTTFSVVYPISLGVIVILIIINYRKRT